MASSSSSSSPEISHAPSALDASFFSHASLDEVLEELSTRFIMNLPDQELASIERISFQVEQAHWYYEDFIREANPKLPSMQLRKFSHLFFNSCPLLRKWSSAHEEIFESFMSYKVTVPVCGAILINESWDKCLLVKGWKSSAGWGFPKGKINQGEPARACAAREVEEEIGFQISNLINEQYIAEQNIRGQRVTLFMVPNVPEDYPFETHTRKEISKIEWFKVTDLPGWKRKQQVTGKFYLVSPFMNTLKEFIMVNKPAHLRQSKRKRAEKRKGDVDGVDLGAPMAVNMDRDANGYSSSSAENNEPYTPSPQSAEAVPVSTSTDEDDSALPTIDPHFARLLNGLSLSASKPSLNGHLDTRPISVTPTSATNTTADKVSASLHSPRGMLEERARLAAANSPLITSLLNIKSPTDSLISEKTVIEPRAIDAVRDSQPSPYDQPAPPSDHRFLKHLALLEAVAQESMAKTPVPAPPPALHPGQPASVPPQFYGSEAHGSFIPNNIVSSRPPPVLSPFPQAHGPGAPRPMTSMSFAPPPPPSNFRHSMNMNLHQHQGNLLSILGKQTGSQPPLSPSQPIGGHIPAGYLSPRSFGMSNTLPLPTLRQQQFPVLPAGPGLGARPLMTPLSAAFPQPPVPQSHVQTQTQGHFNPPAPMGVGMDVNALPQAPAASMPNLNALSGPGGGGGIRPPRPNAGHLLSLLNTNTNIARSATSIITGAMPRPPPNHLSSL